jgi:hypothetical protein
LLTTDQAALSRPAQFVCERFHIGGARALIG